MIDVNSYSHRIILFVSIILIFSNPVCYIKGQTLLPLEIRIIELSYPPVVTHHDEQDPIHYYIRYGIDVKYELENPNNEAVTIWMGNCYSLPFYHINASFEEEELRILYGHSAYTMVCSQSFESGIKTNQSTRINFAIESYTEEELPLGFYTMWIDIDYADVYFPTIISYAFMNITKKGVEVRIEWGEKSDFYPCKVELGLSKIVIPLLILSTVISLIRKSKNKKYFI